MNSQGTKQRSTYVLNYLSVSESHRGCRDCNLHLVAEEVLLVLEKAVEHAPDTGNLLDVALLGAGELLRVELVEPNTLAVVRAL